MTLVTGLKCRKCGHEWYPRRPEPPKVCPHCKRDDWSQPRRESALARFVVIGGGVVSDRDRDTHYISPHRLCLLYGVNPSTAILAHDDDDPVLRGLRLEQMVILRPSGSYDLQEAMSDGFQRMWRKPPFTPLEIGYEMQPPQEGGGTGERT